MRKVDFSAGRTWLVQSHHGVSNFAHHGQHRLFQLGLELRLARLKPGAVVVAREVAQEGEGFGRK